MKKNPYKRIFIAFEGLDGSGQTTQINLLKNYLIKQGFKVVLTKEPTEDNEIGRWVNKTLQQNKPLDLTELKELQNGFAEDRNWHQKNIIEPALEKEKIVITDRSQFSSFAFGAASGVDLDYLIHINEKFIEPDLVILLKVSPKTCVERIQKRDTKQTLFEKEKQLEKVWQVYKKLTKKFKNIVIVDGKKTIEETAQDIKNLLIKKGLI